MKQAEIQAAVMAGQRILVGEFRMSKCETIRWRDQESQSRKEAIVIRHTLEVADGVISVSEFPPDTLKVPEDYKSPFQKGDKVVCQFTNFLITKGNMEARGLLSKLN